MFIKYENQHGDLTNRKKNEKHKDHILVCEFCQKESNQYTAGKTSGKALCKRCYHYESRHGYLTISEQRKNHKDILLCEYCQQKSIKYTASKISGKSLCRACYQYESKNGHLVPPDKRNYYKHFILVCETCQKDSVRYKKGKITGKSLCSTCYQYERTHNHEPNHKNYRFNQHNRLIDAGKPLNTNKDEIEETTEIKEKKNII
jgi:predicted metal-binding protein